MNIKAELISPLIGHPGRSGLEHSSGKVCTISYFTVAVPVNKSMSSVSEANTSLSV